MIDIIPKKKTFNFSLRNSIFLVLLVILIAGGSLYFYSSFTSKNLAEAIRAADKDIAFTQEESQLAESLTALEARIKQYEDLISNHHNGSAVFSLIEQIAHPFVWFSSFEFKAEANRVSLKGSARDFLSLEQQTNILSAALAVDGFSLSGLSIAKDGSGVNFSLELDLNPSVFQ